MRDQRPPARPTVVVAMVAADGAGGGREGEDEWRMRGGRKRAAVRGMRKTREGNLSQGHFESVIKFTLLKPWDLSHRSICQTHASQCLVVHRPLWRHSLRPLTELSDEVGG